MKQDLSRDKTPEELFKPKTIKQLQRLLGMLNWFRTYIPNLSEKLHSVTHKLKKNEKFEWSDQDTRTVKEIFYSISENTVLAYPDLNKPFQLF